MLGSWPIADHPRPPADRRLCQAAAGDGPAGAAARLPGGGRLRGRERQGGDPPPGDGDKPGEEIELDLPLPGLHLKEAQATSYHDLTPHPWAGLPVEIRLVASDALGQTGESEPVRMTLPERVFNNPVARAIIEQRKELANDPDSRLRGGRDPRRSALAPAALPQRRRRLSRRFASPRSGLRLHDDAAAIAAGRAAAVGHGAAHRGRASRRWPRTSCAGCSSSCRTRWRKTRPTREIDRLMSELQQALDRYLQALAANQARNPAAGPAADRSAAAGADQPRPAAHARPRRASWRAAARATRRASCCRSCRTCSKICAGAARRQMQQQESSEAQQMMHGMRELMQRQQQLLDRSFRAAAAGRGGADGGSRRPERAASRIGRPAMSGDSGAGSRRRCAMRWAR